MTNLNTATPRIRRLVSDYEGVRKLVEASLLIRMTALGQPPHRYRIIYHCKGIAKDAHTGRLCICERHVADVYLHVDYPRLAPNVVWRTAIFHPNIRCVDGAGTVCLPGWQPSQGLAEYLHRVGRLVQYQIYDVTYAVDAEAAQWALAHPNLLPVDDRPIIPEALATELGFGVEAAL